MRRGRITGGQGLSVLQRTVTMIPLVNQKYLILVSELSELRYNRVPDFLAKSICMAEHHYSIRVL